MKDIHLGPQSGRGMAGLEGLCGDISNSAADHAWDVGKIVLRVYTHGLKPELWSRCLDLLDRMVEKGAYGIEAPT